MPIIIYQGKPLIVGGQLATSLDCCCFNCACTPDTINLSFGGLYDDADNLIIGPFDTTMSRIAPGDHRWVAGPFVDFPEDCGEEISGNGVWELQFLLECTIADWSLSVFFRCCGSTDPVSVIILITPTSYNLLNLEVDESDLEFSVGEICPFTGHMFSSARVVLDITADTYLC